MFDNKSAAQLLRGVDLGSSVAEEDNALAETRIETSAFMDLLADRVDLVPGTKGSGKSALFRIFVEFLPELLRRQNRVVVAHGVQRHGDSVFHAFKDEFEKLDEEAFVEFWCIYLISLAHEQFIKSDEFKDELRTASSEVRDFRTACAKARIPEIEAQRSLYDILGWALAVLKKWKPRLGYKTPEGHAFSLDLFGQATESPREEEVRFQPMYLHEVHDTLEAVLIKTGFTLWLMVDRLDEIFPRRSRVETLALRGLLRAMRYFSSPRIRVKVFLRDDMLDAIVDDPEGFTALTHLTARRADTLKWSEEDILRLIVRRLFSNDDLRNVYDVDMDRLEASHDYQERMFYEVFPPTVHRGERQSATLRWIYTHTQDGRNVVTPRDVIDLLKLAIQKQQDDFSSDPDGETEYLVGSRAILYAHEELSRLKRINFLRAEFPHHWTYIAQLEGGKSSWKERTLKKLWGEEWRSVVDDLIAIGLIRKRTPTNGGGVIYEVPFLYRKGLELTQGTA